MKYGFEFDNSYTRLNGAFFTRQNPQRATSPALVIFNSALSAELGLHGEALKTGAAVFLSGNQPLEGADPIAQAYAGHQFAHLTMLGDGRAVLLGEHAGPSGRVDVQLKGSGQTVYSRRGDGRAALGPMLREYLVSEAMHALGVPTTRSLAVVTTGDPVFRETVLVGAVLTRIAASHIRVGTFEFAYHYGLAQQKPGLVRELADYTIARHYSELTKQENPYLAFFEALADRQAALVAKWMSFGFIHGVMNTDNMAVSGETIDYGPCAFLDEFAAEKVFSSIDQQGRYAYQNQPGIAQWNLGRLAETLIPLFDADAKVAVEKAQKALGLFNEKFAGYWLSALRAKLGLFTEETEDQLLIGSLLEAMQKAGSDFTVTFRNLAEDKVPFPEWEKMWRARLARQPQSAAEVAAHLRKHNPARIPRNHRVEQVIVAANAGDYGPLNRLAAALAKPFDDSSEFAEFSQAPTSQEQVSATFCGT